MERQNNDKRMSILEANLIFLLCLVLFMTLGRYFQIKSISSGILINEFLFIAFPPLAYVLIRKKGLKNVFRLNRLRLTDAIIVIIIFLSGYFVAVFISLIGSIILSLFGRLIPSSIPIASSPYELFTNILLIAGTAGLCEEILMRGLMLNAYGKMGIKKSIIITGVLFGLMHLNIENLLGPIFLGFVLGYVVYTTNSIFASMLGHFVNNAIAVAWGYAITSLPFFNNVSASTAEITTISYIASAFLFLFIALFAGVIMYFALLALRARAMDRARANSNDMPGCIEEGNDENNNEQQEAKVTSIGRQLGNVRASWPLYIAALIYLFWAYYDMYYIINGFVPFKI